MIIDFWIMITFILAFLHLIILWRMGKKEFNITYYFLILIRYLGLYGGIVIFLFLLGVTEISSSYKSILMGIGGITIFWLSIEDLVKDFIKSKKKKRKK